MSSASVRFQSLSETSNYKVVSKDRRLETICYYDRGGASRLFLRDIENEIVHVVHIVRLKNTECVSQTREEGHYCPARTFNPNSKNNSGILTFIEPILKGSTISNRVFLALWEINDRH